MKEKGILGDGLQGGIYTGHHHTWSTKFIMKTVRPQRG